MVSIQIPTIISITPRQRSQPQPGLCFEVAIPHTKSKMPTIRIPIANIVAKTGSDCEGLQIYQKPIPKHTIPVIRGSHQYLVIPARNELRNIILNLNKLNMCFSMLKHHLHQIVHLQYLNKSLKSPHDIISY